MPPLVVLVSGDVVPVRSTMVWAQVWSSISKEVIGVIDLFDVQGVLNETVGDGDTHLIGPFEEQVPCTSRQSDANFDVHLPQIWDLASTQSWITITG